MEQFKWGMEYLRVTQGYGRDAKGNVIDSYSHRGAYAIDIGGKDASTKDYVLTGCTLEVLRTYGSYNATWFTNVNEVQIATGEIKPARSLIMMLLHADNSTMSELGIKAGKIFYPGDRIYREGNGGGVASHVHLEVGEGPFTGTGWAASSYKDYAGNAVWIINKPLKPHEVFILGDDVIELPPNSGVDFPYHWVRASELKVQGGGGAYTHPNYSKPLGEGIDLSKNQVISDYSKVDTSKYSFALVRAISSTTARGIYIDDEFYNHIKFAKAKGLHLGSYIYTYAFNTKEAEDEIQMFLKAMKDVKGDFDMPVFIDMEDKLIAPQGKIVNRQILDYFVKRLNQEGFPVVGYYSGTNWTNAYMDLSGFDGPIWMRDYRGYCGYQGRVDIWQDGGVIINGIAPNNVDHDYIYTDLVIAKTNAPAGNKIGTLTITGSYIEYFNSKSVDDVAGKLLQGEVYDLISYDDKAYTVPGTSVKGNWATFSKNGKTYWTLVFSDKAVVEKIETITVSNKKLRIIASSIEYFNSRSVNDTAGRLLQGETYEVVTYETSESTIPGSNFKGHWLTFIKDGQTYWTIVFDDRAKVEDVENCAELKAQIAALEKENYELRQLLADTDQQLTARLSAATQLNSMLADTRAKAISALDAVIAAATKAKVDFS